MAECKARVLPVSYAVPCTANTLKKTFPNILILRRLGLLFFLFEFFLSSHPATCFEPMSVELHQTGTFRTLYRLSYRAAATLKR